MRSSDEWLVSSGEYRQDKSEVTGNSGATNWRSCDNSEVTCTRVVKQAEVGTRSRTQKLSVRQIAR